MDLSAAAAALESYGLGVWMRTSPIAYPAANLAYLFGLVLLASGIGAVDLRVLGFGRAMPLAALARFLAPLAVAGVLLMLASGTMLFAADAAPLLRSPLFGWKLAVIALALVNALVFEGLWRRRLENWTGRVPLAARLMAGLSIVLWLTAVTLGRLLAYT